VRSGDSQVSLVHTRQPRMKQCVFSYPSNAVSVGHTATATLLHVAAMCRATTSSQKLCMHLRGLQHVRTVLQVVRLKCASLTHGSITTLVRCTVREVLAGNSGEQAGLSADALVLAHGARSHTSCGSQAATRLCLRAAIQQHVCCGQRVSDVQICVQRLANPDTCIASQDLGTLT
jgi:hypothetical protein